MLVPERFRVAVGEPTKSEGIVSPGAKRETHVPKSARTEVRRGGVR